MGPTSTPRTMLLDFDGVLRRWPQCRLGIESRFGLPPGTIESAAFEPSLLSQAITGQIDDDMWRTRICQRLAPTIGHDAARAAVAAWSASAGEVDTDVLHALDDYPIELVLVTNATSRLGSDLRILGLQNLFAHVVNSAEVGAAKPDPAIFVAALAVAQAAPSDVVFVDDQAANVQVASSMGIRSHQFTNVEGLRRFLDDVVTST